MTVLVILDAVKKIIPESARQRLKRWNMVERFYDRAVITHAFHAMFGRRPNFSNPTTFNEKIAYKMLFDRRPLLTRIADKVRVRDYVAERVGAQYLTSVYQICELVDQINWQHLPESFVIKTNHGSRMNIFVRDKSKIDVAEVKLQLSNWLGRNFYHHLREWCYRDIPRLIMIEELLSEEGGRPPQDWRFHVFDGRAKYVEVGFGLPGDRRKNIYDRQLKRLRARWISLPNSPEDPIIPGNVEAMFSVADILGRGLDYVRVDLYNISGRIVFGELTNYPNAGRIPLEPPEFDEIMGRAWRCPSQYV